MAWVDQGNGQIGVEQGFEHGSFQASGGLDDNGAGMAVAQ